MTWLKLTRTSFQSFRTVLVNMEKVTMVQSSQDGRGSTVWFGKSEVDVCETVDQIAAMLPFGAQPVPGNYRSSDG